MSKSIESYDTLEFERFIEGGQDMDATDFEEDLRVESYIEEKMEERHSHEIHNPYQIVVVEDQA